MFSKVQHRSRMIPGRVLTHPDRSDRLSGLPVVVADPYDRGPGALPALSCRQAGPRRKPQGRFYLSTWTRWRDRGSPCGGPPDGHQGCQDGSGGPVMDWDVSGHVAEAISVQKNRVEFFDGISRFPTIEKKQDYMPNNKAS